MFKKGDLVTGTSHNPYSCTTEYSLCIVDRVVNERMMVVTIVAHARGITCCATDVQQQYFTHCTYAEFMEKYPTAALTDRYSAKELSKIKNGENEEEIIVETVMDKEKIGSYELSKEEKDTLRKEMMTLLKEFDYKPSEFAVNKIIDEWVKNKGWLINVFKKHPNYNGKFQIAFDSDYNRVSDKNIVHKFSNYLYDISKEMLKKERVIGAFSYKEIRYHLSKLDDVISYMQNINSISGYNVSVNGRTLAETKKEYDRWKVKYNEYRSLEEIYITNGTAYDRESYRNISSMDNISSIIYGYYDHIANDEFARRINGYFPKVKAVAGQKVSRIVNKLCKQLGLDKHPDFNREFAKYSDAINPLAIKRHTVISCHPIDYLTMSFGNSWASCHTIDKSNKRKMPNDYSGCYSSGTLSYMLDGSSFVYYTVDKDYNGNEYELQDKINRNMFHIGEDKLIQARVYPQSTDGEEGIYKQIREICQKVIADCLEVPNMWKNEKGADKCLYVTNSYGTHYRDYTNFDDCNVSFLKNEEDVENTKQISIGHNPICPCCGKEHSWQECIECEGCWKGEKQCENCGDYYDSEDMHCIDGDWYCEDCCFYCTYHERWEVGNEDEDSYYVNGLGRVCEDALDSDYIHLDECYGEYFDERRYEGFVETEDGCYFMNNDNAERSGYDETSDGEWYKSSEIRHCEHCGEYVHESNWNVELGCCTDCESDVKESEAV